MYPLNIVIFHRLLVYQRESRKMGGFGVSSDDPPFRSFRIFPNQPNKKCPENVVNPTPKTIPE
jgi:hypothetical protein